MTVVQPAAAAASAAHRPHGRHALAAGLVTVVLWASTFAGIRDAGEALSPGLVTLGPIFIAVLAGVVLREEISARQVTFLACAVGARTSAGRIGALTYLVPPIAIVLGWLLLDEVAPGLAIVGGALCLAGVFWTRRG